jgi:myo-inositol-1(or 4)-monophosphatase
MHPILNIALKAARQAGDIMLQALDRLDTIHATSKGRHDFVTDIDKRSEAKIIDLIKKAYPDHSIVGEESGSHKGNAEFVWIIDPLDGTHNYMRGFPHFAVSIGFKQKGKMEHGLVYDPIRQEIFSASRGHGARVNDKRIRVSPTIHLENALIGTGFPVRKMQALPSYLDYFKQLMPEISNIRCSGSAALDLCYVAASRLDAFIEIGLSPWDMAAGSVIVQEAGGLICDWQGETNYLENGTVIASTPKILHALTKATAGIQF